MRREIRQAGQRLHVEVGCCGRTFGISDRSRVARQLCLPDCLVSTDARFELLDSATELEAVVAFPPTQEYGSILGSHATLARASCGLASMLKTCKQYVSSFATVCEMRAIQLSGGNAQTSRGLG